jgi:peroxiredoxin
MSKLFTPFAVFGAMLLLTAAPALARFPGGSVLPVNTQAPDFSALLWTGGTFNLSDYRGKTVVLDFWATWCKPRNDAMPHLQEIYDRYADKNVVVLALCVWDTPEHADAWIPQHPDYKFTFALDPAGNARANGIFTTSTGNAYLVTAIPTTYIIDPSGNIVDDGVSMDEDEIAAAVDTSLKRAVVISAS